MPQHMPHHPLHMQQPRPQPVKPKATPHQELEVVLLKVMLYLLSLFLLLLILLRTCCHCYKTPRYDRTPSTLRISESQAVSDDGINTSIARSPSAKTSESKSTRGWAAVAVAAADPHASFRAVNLQIVRLQEQQQQHQQFFAKQLRLLHDHQQQQQTSMEQFVQLYIYIYIYRGVSIRR
jgi:hypothetical protein